MLVRIQEDSLGETVINSDHVTHASLYEDGDNWFALVELVTGRMLTVFVTVCGDGREAAVSTLMAILNGWPSLTVSLNN